MQRLELSDSVIEARIKEVFTLMETATAENTARLATLLQMPEIKARVNEFHHGDGYMLSEAIDADNEAAVALLLQAGASLLTAPFLHGVAFQGNVNIIAHLLRAGAAVNQVADGLEEESVTALDVLTTALEPEYDDVDTHPIIIVGYVEVIRLLRAAGGLKYCEPQSMLSYDPTVLAEYGLSHLAPADAVPPPKCLLTDRVVTQAAGKFVCDDDSDSLRRLLHAGLNPNGVCGDLTLLNVAAISGSVSAAALLIGAGARTDIHCRTTGFTALDIAESSVYQQQCNNLKGRPVVARLLRAAGCVGIDESPSSATIDLAYLQEHGLTMLPWSPERHPEARVRDRQAMVTMLALAYCDLKGRPIVALLLNLRRLPLELLFQVFEEAVIIPKCISLPSLLRSSHVLFQAQERPALEGGAAPGCSRLTG